MLGDLISETRFIGEKTTQIRLFGTGNYIKIDITETEEQISGKTRSAQAAISVLKLWGRITRKKAPIYNKFSINLPKDYKTRLDQKKVDFSRIHPFVNSNEIYYEKKLWPEIDADSKELFNFLIDKKNKLLKMEDFYGLKRIKTAIEKVLKIGAQIFELQIALEQEISQENYQAAIDIKTQIQQLMSERDLIDIIFESDHFIESTIMKDSFDDYQKRVLPTILENSAKENVDSQNLKNVSFQKSSLKNISSNLKKKQKFESEKNTKKVNLKIENSEDSKLIFHSNSNTELDDIFLRLADKYNTGFTLNHQNSNECLLRMDSLGIIDVFGTKIWSCVSDSNWRLREIAGKTVIEYIKSDLITKFKGNTERLFISCCEFCKILLDDKVIQIYIDGLQLLGNSLSQNVCGTDINFDLFQRHTNEFVPLLIKKVSELNHRTKDLSLDCLVKLFKHPFSKIEFLIDELQDICEKKAEKFSIPQIKCPIEKLKDRIILGRLEIFSRIIQEFPEKVNLFWNLLKVLALPAFKHPDLKVRAMASEICECLEKLNHEKTGEILTEFGQMNPFLMDDLIVRLKISQSLIHANKSQANLSHKYNIKGAIAEENNEAYESMNNFNKSKMTQSGFSKHKNIYEGSSITNKSKYLNSTRLFNSNKSKFKLKL